MSSPYLSVPENLSLEISRAAIILYDLESTVTEKLPWVGRIALCGLNRREFCSGEASTE